MALAAAATGMAPDPSTAVRRLSQVRNEYTADPAVSDRYREIFQLYTDLYAANENLFDRLEKIKQD
jgi:sugar (pentulose or hexulose) kinase